jgi:hypothetical protein
MMQLLILLTTCYINVYGDAGNMRLMGYDWETNGVILDVQRDKPAELLCTHKDAFEWHEGATKVGEVLQQNLDPRINAEHAPQVLEIIEAAQKRQGTGRHIALQSSFPWPIIQV